LRDRCRDCIIVACVRATSRINPALCDGGLLAMAFLTELEKNPGTIPASPGVYMMKSKAGEIIYVGKAKDLRARLRTYFRDGDSRHSIKFLMARVVAVDFIVTNNEKEALLLENTLIKQHRPRYNIRLKDDKTYVSLRLDPREDFPRLTIVRRYRRDGALYFGPYSSAAAVRDTLRTIQEIFPIRRCPDHVFRNRTRPCLNCQMGRCTGPCCGLISKEEYHKLVDEVVLFLKGRNDDLVRELKGRMEQASAALEFERAARLRDRLRAIEQTLEKQQAVSAAGFDRDVFGLYSADSEVHITVLFIRDGKLIETGSYTFRRKQMTVAEVFSSFITQFYSADRDVPTDILVPVDVEDAGLLEEVLTERRGRKVTVHCPKRGEKVRLVEMAAKNAEDSATARRAAADLESAGLAALGKKLRLPRVPSRIECVDISNIGGTDAVGSLVTFDDGKPNKSRYRRYRIKSVSGADDYGMMKEVLTRRYTRALAENDLPDLLIVDGGKGQLSIAVAVLRELGVEGVTVAALAKPAHEGEHDKVFLPGRKNPVRFPASSAALHLLQRIRDEAHRFAVTYHRKLRDRSRLRSVLTDVPGVGEKRKKALLAHFGSLQQVKQASVEELGAVPGIPDSLARRVYLYLHQDAIV
jgi:excinuclease ABC subunit C